MTRVDVAPAPSARPTVLLAVAGGGASAVAVWAAGRVGPVHRTTPLTTWLGLLSRHGPGRHNVLPGWILLASIAVLGLLWLAAVRLNTAPGAPEGRVWWLAGIWSTPFVLGPPLFSGDLYTYAAQGIMIGRGFDPYRFGPAVLGDSPIVAAVDHKWRGVPSPYGPVASALERSAVVLGGGGPLGAMIVLRAVEVLAVVAIGILAAALARDGRARALTLIVLNPLLLLQVISAVHFEGVMCAFLLAALVAADRGRWTPALLFGCVAGSVKAPAFLVVLAILVVHTAGRRGRAAWRLAARDAMVAASGTALLALLTGNGFGWIHALQTPAKGYTRLAPTSVLANLLNQIVHPDTFDDVETVARYVGLFTAGCLVTYLLATARKRRLSHTVGAGLIAVGLLSPVVYPWYLLWGMVCLLPTVQRPGRDWLMLATGLGLMASVVGLPAQTQNIVVAAATVAGLAWLAPRTLRAAWTPLVPQGRAAPSTRAAGRRAS